MAGTMDGEGDKDEIVRLLMENGADPKAKDEVFEIIQSLGVPKTYCMNICRRPLI